MAIWDISYKYLWKANTPPILRNEKGDDWGDVLMTPIDTKQSIIFDDYINGSLYATWGTSQSFGEGVRVIYKNRNVWQASANNINQEPGPTSSYWFLTNDNYIGINERKTWNSQIIVLNNSMNRWFQTSGMYISNAPQASRGFLMSDIGPLSSDMSDNSVYSSAFMGSSYTPPAANNFSVYVPTATYTGLGLDAEGLIRGFVDRFVLAGISYNIVQY